MNRKAKGTNAERQLVHAIHSFGWSCLRAAGSGSSRYPCPDILAGNGSRRLAIECKVTKEKRKYFSAEDVQQLRIFARNFGAESWLGVKFGSEDWYFVMLEDLIETKSAFVISLDVAERRGLRLKELLES